MIYNDHIKKVLAILSTNEQLELKQGIQQLVELNHVAKEFKPKDTRKIFGEFKIGLQYINATIEATAHDNGKMRIVLVLLTTNPMHIHEMKGIKEQFI